MPATWLSVVVSTTFCTTPAAFLSTAVVPATPEVASVTVYPWLYVIASTLVSWLSLSGVRVSVGAVRSTVTSDTTDTGAALPALSSSCAVKTWLPSTIFGGLPVKSLAWACTTNTYLPAVMSAADNVTDCFTVLSSSSCSVPLASAPVPSRLTVTLKPAISSAWVNWLSARLGIPAARGATLSTRKVGLLPLVGMALRLPAASCANSLYDLSCAPLWVMVSVY